MAKRNKSGTESKIQKNLQLSADSAAQAANDNLRVDEQEQEQMSELTESFRTQKAEVQGSIKEQAEGSVANIDTEELENQTEALGLHELNDQDQDISMKQTSIGDKVDKSKWGTSEQTEIIEDYQMSTDDEKLLVPYIERMNGNICVAKGQFEDSVKHYNKGLLSLRMLFEMEQPVVKDQLHAVKLIKEVEILSCINLAHSYIKLEQYHYAIKYASQALEKEPKNTKALFRKGVAYTMIGELERARECLSEIVEIDPSMKAVTNKALQDVKNIEVKNKRKEKEMSQRMIAGGKNKDKAKVEAEGGLPKEGSEVPEQVEAANVEQTFQGRVWELIQYLMWLPYTISMTMAGKVVQFSIEKIKVVAAYMAQVWAFICELSPKAAFYAEKIPYIGDRLAWVLNLPPRFNLKEFLELILRLVKKKPEPEIVQNDEQAAKKNE